MISFFGFPITNDDPFCSPKNQVISHSPHPPLHSYSLPIRPPKKMQISSQGRSVAEIKNMAAAAADHSAQKKVDIGQAVMSILKRTWAKYQQLLITHPWKTQIIGTGNVINEIPFLT